METKKTEKNIIRQLEDARLRPPKTVTLGITNRCNLNCNHCWPDSLPDVAQPLVPKKKVLRLIKSFSALAAETFVITGGEPLLHPDWHEILSFAATQPSVNEIRLQTNGTLINSSHVDDLLFLKDKGLIIQISVDGARPSTHDQIRGQGSFKRTMQGLQLLIKGGLAHLISLAFTEMQHNFNDIPELLEMSEQMGISKLVTGTLVSGGRAAASRSLMPPTPAQYERLLIQYRNDPVFRDRYQRIGNIAALEWSSTTESAADTSCALLESPYVNAEGTLYPCVMLHANDFAAREVYNRPLETAISEKIVSWSQLGKVSRLRRNQLNDCKECPDYLKCGAGCMGRAYMAHDDFFTAEDRCNHRKTVYRYHSKGVQLP